MPEHDQPARSFEQLWQRVVAEPVQRIETGDDDEVVFTADRLVAWLTRIADDCHAEQLITAEQHEELQQCNATYARILGALPADRLSPKLKSLSDIEG